ncbi:hypothetical protein MMC13_002562 [Lambiella insularis]|nr:hypothetical protein [Lambiella insularis]
MAKAAVIPADSDVNAVVAAEPPADADTTDETPDDPVSEIQLPTQNGSYDVVAAVVIRRVGLYGIPHRVPEDLDHGLRGRVVPRGTWAQARPTAVDPKAGDTANLNDGDGNDAQRETRLPVTAWVRLKEHVFLPLYNKNHTPNIARTSWGHP